MKNIKAFVFLFAILTGSLAMYAQEKKADEIKRIVESQNYIFKAQTVHPQSGISRQLSPDYDVTVTKDNIISYLPYFGRAYSAPVNPAEGGIKFTSSAFDYKPVKTSKGWEITIKPKDASEVQQLYLTVFDNGNAILQVMSTNRQAISFEGYITEGKEKQKKAF